MDIAECTGYTCVAYFGTAVVAGGLLGAVALPAALTAGGFSAAGPIAASFASSFVGGPGGGAAAWAAFASILL
jgi:hypothetical protein